MRIALHDFLPEICEELQVQHRVRDNNDLELLRRRFVKVSALMSSEICASVPFYLRKLNADGRKNLSDAQQFAVSCALIRMLATTAKCRCHGDAHGLVAKATLAGRGHAIGMRQATRKLSGLSERASNALFSHPQRDMDLPTSVTGLRLYEELEATLNVKVLHIIRKRQSSVVAVVNAFCKLSVLKGSRTREIDQSARIMMSLQRTIGVPEISVTVSQGMVLHAYGVHRV